MKKMAILMSVFLVSVLLGSVSTPLTQTSASAPDVPKISNLEIPTTVKAGDSFPVSFDYEDEDANITTVVVTFDWGKGQETHPFTVTKFSKKSGKYNGRLRIGPNAGPMKIHVYVEDAKGNKSNILTKEIQRVVR